MFVKRSGYRESFMSYYLKSYSIGNSICRKLVCSPLKITFWICFYDIYYRVSKPEQILYNSSGMISDMEDEIDIGPEVIHLYEVRLPDFKQTFTMVKFKFCVSFFVNLFVSYLLLKDIKMSREARCSGVSICSHFGGGLKFLV